MSKNRFPALADLIGAWFHQDYDIEGETIPESSLPSERSPLHPWATESIAGIIYRIDAADVMKADSAEIWMRGGLAAPPAGSFGPSGHLLAGNTLFVADGMEEFLDLVATGPESAPPRPRLLSSRRASEHKGLAKPGPM